MTRWACPLAFALATAAAAAHSHHSIGSVYDRSQQVTLEGLVAEFRFVNPHPLLIIVALGTAEGETWQLEMDSRRELADIGMTAETFLPGDRVVVIGSLHRTEPRSLYLRRLDRPADRARYEQIGSTPSFSD